MRRPVLPRPLGPGRAFILRPGLALDAEWNEQAHPRAKNGQFGEGGSGSAAPLPVPSKWHAKHGELIKASVVSGMAAGDKPEAIADKIKKISASYAHPLTTSHANAMLKHLEQVHGLKAGELGKAAGKKKPEGPAKESDAPSEAEMDKMAEAGAAEVLPTPAQAAKATGPMPHPDSGLQKEVYEIATGPGTDAEKAAKIKEVAATMYQAGHAKKFADQWIDVLSDAKPAPGFAPAAYPKVSGPGPAPATSYKNLPRHQHPATNVQRAGTDRYSKGEKLEKVAKTPSTTDSAEAKKIVPSLKSSFWNDVSYDTKMSVSLYGGSEYHGINAALRDTAVAAPKYQAHVGRIDELFEDDDTVATEAVVVRRGEDTPKDVIDQWRAALKKGWPPVVYQRSGYTSASVADEPAFSHKPVWHHFTCKKGTRILGVAGHVGHHENEVLLQHGQTVEIYEIYEAGGKVHVKGVVK